MSKNFIKNSTIVVLIFITILLFLKVDFRLETDIYCCSDDFDYYKHAETIAIDFDLDYSNQLLNYEDARFFQNNKPAPIGFIGSGLLAAPFLLFGNYLDKYISINTFLNYKIFFYSFSSIFYLLLTLVYLLKIKNLISTNFKNFDIVIIFLGSGITYYSFERFSMTHTYEAFSITMICYFVVKFSTFNQRRYFQFDILFLSFFLFLSFNIRWVNYFIFLIPYFLPKLLGKKNNIIKNQFFYIYNFLFLLITLFVNKEIYGFFTLNPNNIYRSSNIGSSFEVFFDFKKSIKSFFNILFGQEFGLYLFSPVIFFGIVILLFNLSKNFKEFYNYVGLAMFGQVISIVILWQSTAASYGYRYLLCLAPLSTILIIDFFQHNYFSYKKTILNIIIFCSIFSLISTLFFETTPLTQLSLDETLNSFENKVRYTQPNYLNGYLLSLVTLEAYLKLFVTSYLGLLFFNIIFKFLNVDEFYAILNRYGMNYENEKVNELLFQYQLIDIKYILLIITLFLLISIFLKKLIF